MGLSVESLHRGSGTVHRSDVIVPNVKASKVFDKLALTSLQPFNASTSAIKKSPQPFPDKAERIVKLVHHAFLERNDGVVRDVYIFRTNVGAALRDVAVA